MTEYTALETVQRMIRDIASGNLSPAEPVFVLRARDATANGFVEDWAEEAERIGAPAEKVAGAIKIAEAMRSWPVVRSVPGRGETLRFRDPSLLGVHSRQAGQNPDVTLATAECPQPEHPR